MFAIVLTLQQFLPAKKVKEKAGRLKRSFAKDMLTGTPSQNILALTFRQVVMQQLWNFELVVFEPGTERNMGDLENPREVEHLFFLLIWVLKSELLCFVISY